MAAQKTELRFIVKSTKHDDTIVVISNSPGVIQDIQDAIDYSKRKQKNISFTKNNMQYTVDAKSFSVIQNIISDILE